MIPDRDQADSLSEAVRAARDTRTPLQIVGSGSKTFLTGACEAAANVRLLSVIEHCGIVDYRPEELVVTARAGTRLVDLEQALARQGQRLPFEPPRFHGGGTLGGALACGLSGPGRPWFGAVRDAVLGVDLINGYAERLRFGGQVMKNVAGYDASRLQVGAFGTFGVILAASIKVLPLPAQERTLTFELPAVDALERCRRWALRAYPISATCWWEGILRVRLSGAEPAVAWAAADLGGDVRDDTDFWSDLRDHRLAFLRGADDHTRPLWRCSMPPAAAAPLAGCLIGWAGAERWARPGDAADAERLAATVRTQGGHARPFDGRYGLRAGPHVPAPEALYAARLKQAFDPLGIFNPELSAAIEPEALLAD
jgi:glycolate oxidase FAD binding subunit